MDTGAAEYNDTQSAESDEIDGVMEAMCLQLKVMEAMIKDGRTKMRNQRPGDKETMGIKMARELKQKFAKAKEKSGWQSSLRKGGAGADRLIDVQDVAGKLVRLVELKTEK